MEQKWNNWCHRSMAVWRHNLFMLTMLLSPKIPSKKRITRIIFLAKTKNHQTSKYNWKNLAQCGGPLKLMNYCKLAFESHYLDTQGWFSRRTGISLDNRACSTNTQVTSNQTRIQTIPHALTSSSAVHVLLLNQPIGANWAIPPGPLLFPKSNEILWRSFTLEHAISMLVSLCC